jgi:hypothetical protein
MTGLAGSDQWWFLAKFFFYRLKVDVYFMAWPINNGSKNFFQQLHIQSTFYIPMARLQRQEALLYEGFGALMVGSILSRVRIWLSRLRVNSD